MRGASVPSLDASERRAHHRFDISLPAKIGGFFGRTENLSEGGVCLQHDPGRSFEIGERIEVDIEVPGRGSAKLDAEVRWSGRGRTGVQFRGGARWAIAAFLTTMVAASNVSAAQTTVPEFDPTADVELDMKAGGERPDDYTVLQAFEQQYDAFDKCVMKAKKGRDGQLPGDVDVEVLLNPRGDKPLGVNAKLPSKVKKNKGLRECLRSAVAQAPYPSYDGVPVVVAFSFELDPGSDWVEEE